MHRLPLIFILLVLFATSLVAQDYVVIKSTNLFSGKDVVQYCPIGTVVDISVDFSANLNDNHFIGTAFLKKGWIDINSFSNNDIIKIRAARALYLTDPYKYNNSIRAKTTVSELKSDQKENKKTIKDEENTTSLVPPILEISDIRFVDKNFNKRIDANENCSIQFKLQNIGKGPAKNLVLNIIDNTAINDLQFNKNISIGLVSANSRQEISIPITGGFNLSSGLAKFKISFSESKGFPPDPFEINIETKEFVKPLIKVVDYSFLTDNASIKLGLPVQLKILIQNVGQGIADDVQVSFTYPSKNIFPTGSSEFNFGSIQQNATKEVVFEFVANKLYSEKSIPVTINATEKYKKFGEVKTVSAIINESTYSAITISSNPSDAPININVASLSADVDKNIPSNNNKHSNRYALIIGNEDYSSRQMGLSSESNVAFAKNDAITFNAYAINTLGVEPSNCFLLTNATAAEMSQKIEKVAQILQRIGPNSELIFYYSGHGFPDENTKVPYLIPVDVNASSLQSALKLSDICKKFAQTNASRITFFLDACFTGGGREQSLVSSRGIKIIPQENLVSGNMVVFCATSADQSALPYKANQHGLYTYFLLKKLQESKGNVTYGELESYLINAVSVESLKVNDKPQDPKVNVSTDIQNTWKSWIIK